VTPTPKTERERAEEALGVADRKVKRTEGKLATARKLVKDLEAELEPLKARRAFLASDPALPQRQTGPDPTLEIDDDEQLDANVLADGRGM